VCPKLLNSAGAGRSRNHCGEMRGRAMTPEATIPLRRFWLSRPAGQGVRRGAAAAGKAAVLLRSLELAARPVHPESRAALDPRWSQLPGHVKTPAQ